MPKSYEQLEQGFYRAQMRSYALRYRAEINPSNVLFRRFGDRVNQAAHTLKLAIDYRNMAGAK